MPISADDTRAAAQGRRIAAGLGHDVAHTSLSDADWADYGRRASHALEKGNIVPHPVTTPALAPARPAPAAPAAPSASGGGGRSYSVRAPSIGGDAATRLVVGIIAGLVVLQVGSMITGQYFSWGFGKGATPAAPPAPPAFKPLFPGQHQTTSAGASAAQGIGKVAAGTGA
jgi:hypothetical protein